MITLPPMIIWERETDLSHLRRVYVDQDLDASLCLSFFEVVFVDWHVNGLSARHRYTARRRWDLRTQESSMVRGHQSLASSIAKYRVRRDSTLHGWHLKPFAYLRVIQRKWNMWEFHPVGVCVIRETIGKDMLNGLPDFHMFGFASMWFQCW